MIYKFTAPNRKYKSPIADNVMHAFEVETGKDWYDLRKELADENKWFVQFQECNGLVSSVSKDYNYVFPVAGMLITQVEKLPEGFDEHTFDQFWDFDTENMKIVRSNIRFNRFRKQKEMRRLSEELNLLRVEMELEGGKTRTNDYKAKQRQFLELSRMDLTSPFDWTKYE